jgi:two-component system NtrC family response regulator
VGGLRVFWPQENSNMVRWTGNGNTPGGRPRLLVVDDDESILQQIRWALSEEYDVYAAGDRRSALTLFKSQRIPLVLLDLGLPPEPREASEGLQTLEELLGENPRAKVIIVSGNAQRENALRAVERGACDIFPKPVDIDELRIVLRRVSTILELEQERERQDAPLPARLGRFEEMIGSSPCMLALFAALRRVAASDIPVLITGESGTGKEQVAKAIHNLSGRKGGPFIAINCGAIPENLLESELFGHEKGTFTGATAQRRGKLEYAQGGTLFLDEIGELASALQVKLLRFLQEKVLERVGGREQIPVDSRVVAATNQDLSRAVAENRFREDLYFRLAGVRLAVPPLRERGDDVIELAEHLAESFARELKRPAKKFSRQALLALRAHPWMGNVRELQNRVRRAVMFADGPSIGPADLELEAAGPAAPGGVSLKEAREHFERDLLAKTMAENKGNISRTARALGISRSTLYELLRKYEGE